MDVASIARSAQGLKYSEALSSRGVQAQPEAHFSLQIQTHISLSQNYMSVLKASGRALERIPVLALIGKFRKVNSYNIKRILRIYRCAPLVAERCLS